MTHISIISRKNGITCDKNAGRSAGKVNEP
jgi:hypothetical protein